MTLGKLSIGLVPRPAFFAGRWKSEGPGISCMHMHSIPPFRGDSLYLQARPLHNRNKHYIIVELALDCSVFLRLDSTHLTPRSVLCKLFMKEVICLCRYQLVRREESLLSKYRVLSFVFDHKLDLRGIVLFLLRLSLFSLMWIRSGARSS